MPFRLINEISDQSNPYYCYQNTPLWQRGERGDFLDNVLITEIPPNLPFPKGGISGYFHSRTFPYTRDILPARKKKAHERSTIELTNTIQMVKIFRKSNSEVLHYLEALLERGQ